MARDEQEGQRNIMQVFRDVAMRGAEAVTGRPIVLRCKSCGEWIQRHDREQCGNHLPIPEGADPIYVHFAASPEPALPEPPKVERLGRSSDKRQVSNRYKDPTKPDPVAPEPTDEQPEDIWADVRNKTAYRRREAIDTDWGMSSEELSRAQDRASGELDDDDHDPTPTLPTYLG